MHILLCHSVLGLRDVERRAADRLRGAGHVVSVPDLFGGSTADSIQAGAEIVQRIGWSRVRAAAERELRDLPAETVLMGFSMGVGVSSELWLTRPLSGGAVFLHALPTIPSNVRPSFPLQVHVGEIDDVFADALSLAKLGAEAGAARACMEVFRYSGAGHFFTDDTLSEFDGPATQLTWDRVQAFLASLDA